MKELFNVQLLYFTETHPDLLLDPSVTYRHKKVCKLKLTKLAYDSG